MSKQEKIEQMVRKYKSYVSNLKWNMEHNSFPTAQQDIIRARIDAYNEIIGDLQTLLAKPKSIFQ